jgi:heme oxygenase
LCKTNSIEKKKMADLKALSDSVAAIIAKQDGSWQLKHEMLDAIEELRVTAMGPSEYITRLRYRSLQNMSIVMALEMNLVQRIGEMKGHPVTATELATSTGSDELLVGKRALHKRNTLTLTR